MFICLVVCLFVCLFVCFVVCFVVCFRIFADGSTARAPGKKCTPLLSIALVMWTLSALCVCDSCTLLSLVLR